MTTSKASLNDKVLLSIISILVDDHGALGLEAFLRAQPRATSLTFISWLAGLENEARGIEKERLARICETLVTFAEVLDIERMDALYLRTLQKIAEKSHEEAALAVSEPMKYGTVLAETLTEQPVLTQGFNGVYDLLLSVAPPAALTLEGVQMGLEQADKLAQVMRSRRQQSFVSIVGQALGPEEAMAMAAGTAASRILDMLLELPNSQHRELLLRDCFTPPGDFSDAPSTEDQELLWCTPAQLLNEIELRLSQYSSNIQETPTTSRIFLPAVGQVKEGKSLEALGKLREAVKHNWLQEMGGYKHEGQC